MLVSIRSFLAVNSSSACPLPKRPILSGKARHPDPVFALKLYSILSIIIRLIVFDSHTNITSEIICKENKTYFAPGQAMGVQLGQYCLALPWSLSSAKSHRGAS